MICDEGIAVAGVLNQDIKWAFDEILELLKKKNSIGTYSATIGNRYNISIEIVAHPRPYGVSSYSGKKVAKSVYIRGYGDGPRHIALDENNELANFDNWYGF